VLRLQCIILQRVLNIGVHTDRWRSPAETCNSKQKCTVMYTGHACAGFINEYLTGKFRGRRPVRKTTAETGRNHQEGLAAPTNCGRLEEVRKVLEHLEGKLQSSAKEEEEEEEEEREEEKKEVDKGRRTRRIEKKEVDKGRRTRWRRKRRGGGEGCG